MTNFTDRIRPTHLGISTYLEGLLANQYQVPTFQRYVVWEQGNVKKLWDSVYKFYPLGSILIWKTQTKLHNHRQIGGIVLPTDFSKFQYQYILDGQQRTTSLLTSLHGGCIAGREDFNPTLYIDLTMEMKDATDDSSYSKRFLFWNEIDDRGGTLLANTGKKGRFDAGLIIKLQDVKQNYEAAEERLESSGYAYRTNERAQLRRMKAVLDNYRLSFIELDGIQVAEVCQIFERINQAGKPLGIFDIVVAKTFRAQDDGVAGFYLRERLENFQKSAGMVRSNYASLDELTFLQMLAVMARQSFPDAGISNITDRYLNELRTEHLEAVWEEAERAFLKVFFFLDNVLHLDGPNLIPFRYFYLVFAAYFYENRDPDYRFLERYFWFMSFSDDDLLSNTTQMWSEIQFVRSAAASDDLRSRSLVLNKRKLREAFYSSRGRWSTAVLALLANQEPRDWALPHTLVRAKVYYSLTDKPNLHHIFPTNFVAQANSGESEMVNCLMNIAYIPQITNLRISDRNPLEYLQDYLTLEQFEEVLRGHLIPPELVEWAKTEVLPENALTRFIELRIAAVCDVLRSKMEGVSFVEFDGVIPT